MNKELFFRKKSSAAEKDSNVRWVFILPEHASLTFLESIRMSFGHFSFTGVSVVTRLAMQDAMIVPTRRGRRVMGTGTALRLMDTVRNRLPFGAIQLRPRVPLALV